VQTVGDGQIVPKIERPLAAVVAPEPDSRKATQTGTVVSTLSGRRDQSGYRLGQLTSACHTLLLASVARRSN
jgi:hypothetical protein